MSAGFINRTVNATEFQKQLFRAIEKMDFKIALNGTEHTYPEFVGLLRQSVDLTSLSIRFQPDGVICIGERPRTAYVEAKNADSIERTAYEQYMRLHNAGNLVIVVFGKLTWAWNFVEHIRLVPGEDTIASFPPDMRFPVVGHWIIPRCSDRWYRIRDDNHQASGTPFRKVDPCSLLAWDTFKNTVVERLSQEQTL